VRAPAQPRFGKVFFTENGIRYVCSGTVTTSANRDLVTTAGHCVNAGPGAYVTNFVFVPAYDSGSRPYGTWVARALLTTEAWRTTGDFEHDLGFAVLAEQNGHSIVDITGSYDIAFNLPYGQAFAAYGYPAAPPYDGTTLWRCYGTSGRDLLGGTSDRRLPCTMTGGSSGGGWITGGRLASVTSFGYPGERPPALYGPYLGAVEQATYAAASTS
jgi:hypothetical protein